MFYPSGRPSPYQQNPLQDPRGILPNFVDDLPNFLLEGQIPIEMLPQFFAQMMGGKPNGNLW